MQTAKASRKQSMEEMRIAMETYYEEVRVPRPGQAVGSGGGHSQLPSWVVAPLLCGTLPF